MIQPAVLGGLAKDREAAAMEQFGKEVGQSHLFARQPAGVGQRVHLPQITFVHKRVEPLLGRLDFAEEPPALSRTSCPRRRRREYGPPTREYASSSARRADAPFPPASPSGPARVCRRSSRGALCLRGPRTRRSPVAGPRGWHLFVQHAERNRHEPRQVRARDGLDIVALARLKLPSGRPRVAELRIGQLNLHVGAFGRRDRPNAAAWSRSPAPKAGARLVAASTRRSPPAWRSLSEPGIGLRRRSRRAAL